MFHACAAHKAYMYTVFASSASAFGSAGDLKCLSRTEQAQRACGEEQARKRERGADMLGEQAERMLKTEQSELEEGGVQEEDGKGRRRHVDEVQGHEQAEQDAAGRKTPEFSGQEGGERRRIVRVRARGGGVPAFGKQRKEVCRSEQQKADFFPAFRQFSERHGRIAVQGQEVPGQTALSGIKGKEYEGDAEARDRQKPAAENACGVRVAKLPCRFSEAASRHAEKAGRAETEQRGRRAEFGVEQGGKRAVGDAQPGEQRKEKRRRSARQTGCTGRCAGRRIAFPYTLW